MKRSTRWIVGCMAGVMMTLSPAFAISNPGPDQVQAKLIDVDPNNFTVWLNGYGNEVAGVFEWNILKVGSSVDPVTFQPNQTIMTFCTELTATVSYNGTYNYDVVPIPSASNASIVARMSEIRDLWAYVSTNGLVGFTSPDSSSNPTDQYNQATQLIVWELIYENPANGWDLTSGDFHATGPAGTMTKVNQILANMTGAWNSSLNSDVIILESNSQDQSTYLGGSGLVVPIPAAVWAGLSLMGLFGIGHVVRNRYA